MKLESKNRDGITSIQIVGRLTVDAADEFRAKAEPLIGAHCRLVFDLSQMDYIDSTGLGALVAVLQQVSDAGGRMTLAAIAPKPKIVFDITPADRVFNIFSTVEEAQKSLC